MRCWLKNGKIERKSGVILTDKRYFGMITFLQEFYMCIRCSFETMFRMRRIPPIFIFESYFIMKFYIRKKTLLIQNKILGVLRKIWFSRKICQSYEILTLSRISCNITIHLMWIMRPLGYIKVQHHGVEDNWKGSAAVVLIFYITRYSRRYRPF